MNSNDTDQPHPDYLQILGLRHPVFSAEISADIFYENPDCKNCLDLMLHLGRYSELILLVSGVLGSGKSSLLKQYQARAGGKVFICKIDIDTALDKRQLEDLLATGFGFSSEFDRTEGIKHILRDRLEAICRKYSSVVLLLDNVDKLPASLYVTLKEIASVTDDGGNTLLHIILFGAPSAELELKEIFLDNLKILKLSTYSLEETSKYLQYRLNAVGYPVQQFSELFDSVSILNIYKLSNGLPARISKLAHTRLIEIAEKKAPTLAMKNLKYSSRWQWLASGFVIAIVASAWFMQKDIRQFFIYMQNEYESVLALLEMESIGLSKESVLLKDEHDSNKNDESVLARSSEVSNTLFVLDEEVADREQETSIVVEKVSIEKQTVQLTGDELSPVKLDADVVYNEIKRESWLLAQNGQNFTLQLYGTENEIDINRVAKKYKKKYKLDENIAYFRTRKKGGQWFGLTYGVYSDLAGARQAVSTLPKSLKNDAWIRKLTSIHSEIQKKSQK